MIKIAICDDNKEICTYIESVLQEYQKNEFPNLSVSVFYSAVALYKFLCDNHTFDLIFLDIEMEEMNGVELGERIRKNLNDHITKIAYISGKDTYDRALFDVQPLNFLSKPIDKDKVIDVLKLANKLICDVDKVFTYTKNKDIYKTSLRNIIYFESLNHEIKIVTTNGQDVYYGSILDTFDKLMNKRFITVQRSFIVNYDQVINATYDEVTMSNGFVISIGRSKRKEVRDIISSLERESE